MELNQIKERIEEIAKQRGYLVKLLEQPNLGDLRLDVQQALDELDLLLEELKLTFEEV